MSVLSCFDYDIDPILAILPQLDDVWGEERWRATMPYTPHPDSETIFLRRQPGSRPREVLHQIAAVATRHFAIGPLSDAVHAICEHFGGRPGRAMLVRLRPGGVILPHTDTGAYADRTERAHLPIVTNPGAWLRVDGERYNLAAGTVYAIDKHVEHDGANEGDAPRIHLICDYFPDSAEIFAG